MRKLFRLTSIINIIFLTAIFAPLLDMFLKLDLFPRLYENREPAKRPQLKLEKAALQAFPREYTSFFSDHFGFRNLLVRVNYLVRKEFLNTSPSRDVVLGANGWLFFSGKGELADYRGITRYDADALGKWADYLELKRQWLASQGIRYLFVVAPNKSTMYGEYLPESINRVREQTGLDELMSFLRNNTRVEIIDLRQPLREASRYERTYQKTDTHWNDYGAFVAYREIMTRVAHWFPVVSVDSYDRFVAVRQTRRGGDLASLMGGAEFLDEQYVALRPVMPRKAKIIEKNLSERAPFSMGYDNRTLPRVVVYRDSFLSQVIPFMSEHFQYARYYWQRWDGTTPVHEVVKRDKPDIVIEEVVERMLKYEVPDYFHNYPLFLTDHYKNRFESGLPVYALSSGLKYTINNNSSAAFNGQHLSIVSLDNYPQLIIDGIRFGRNNSHIVKISIGSSVDSILQLFYKDENESDFTEAKSIKVSIHKGDNVLFLPLKGGRLDTSLRIDPAASRGEFILKELEIRSVSG